MDSDEAVGTLALSASGHHLDVLHIWVAPPFRGYGAGSEAARLLEQGARDSDITSLRAWAHPGLGLSTYFLMRMGYRPLHGDGPNGGLWFTRTL
jgi:hypothetical protein